jgi:CRP-like cAMP-binding protein
MSDERHPNENHLLAVLPEAEWARLSPHLTLVDMPLGQVVYESGDHLNHVYFPTTSIVSLLYVMEDGASAEIAIVGNEGLIGIALFMGGETTPSRAVVQSAGRAFRLDARLIKEEFRRAGPMQRLLLRYTQALITQMVQMAAAEPGPSGVERTEDDAGADRQHARCPETRRDRSSDEAARCGTDSLQLWSHRGTGSTGTRKARMRMLWRSET